MKQVSKEEFYSIIFERKLDVHPRPEPDKTFWEFRNRRLFGVSTPGYRCQGEKAYYILAEGE